MIFKTNIVEKYIKYIKNNCEDKELITPIPNEDLEKLIKFIPDKFNLPKELIDVYKKCYPIEKIEVTDFIFYPVEEIIIENTDAIPGSNIFPYGLFTFSSTLDGDAICIDLNDPNYAVYQCSHSLLEDEDEISFYANNKTITKEMNYDNILNFSIKIADTFSEYIKLMSNNKLYDCDVIKTIIDNYKE